jgi:threonine aldolase
MGAGADAPVHHREQDAALAQRLDHPVAGNTGAVVAGSREFVERAWESKYLFGGALRQSGVLAAAALHALDHHVDRLAEDHRRARRLAELVGAEEPETNFVAIPDPGDGIARLREHGVLVSDLRPGLLRAITYLGVGDDDVERAGETIGRVLGGERAAA